MSGIFDWATDEPICEVCGYIEDSAACEAFCGEIDAYADEMHPGAEGIYGGLLPIVDRIRAYTRDEATTAMEIAAVEAYIERGIDECEAYLAKHAAFEDYLRERES